jgi:hypothetical protein
MINRPKATKNDLEDLNMINKDKVRTFTAMFAPKLPVRSIFGEMAQV